MTNRPLDGIRVLEVGQLLAGPFATCLLGYFGAEVVKIETPGQGDPIRRWRILDDGTSFWWRSLARNKRSVTINLREEKGRQLVRELADGFDVLVENFRPGTMEKWGLGPEDLKKTNPSLVYARISGYGQTGPYASRPGFASVCEGIGGLRHLNGFPGEPPVRPNLSLGDSLAGLHAAFGVVLALLARDKYKTGQVIDVALYESMFNMLEGVVPEYFGAGAVRGPSGSTVTGIVPTNTYRCADDDYVIIGANGDSIFQRLMHAIGRHDLADAPRLSDNTGRVKHETEIDAAITAWTGTLDAGGVLEALEVAAVPSGPIYSIADMAADPHFEARGLFEEVDVKGKPLKIPAIIPRLSETPGRTEWAGPDVGEHTDAVLGTELQMSPESLAELRATGII
jgi:crotonobetainyl-CoA:carnitine CoA-transferase CaiB-like acyl-CoA transferase